jgi:hypothetical protein
VQYWWVVAAQRATLPTVSHHCCGEALCQEGKAHEATDRRIISRAIGRTRTMQSSGRWPSPLPLLSPSDAYSVLFKLLAEAGDGSG